MNIGHCAEMIRLSKSLQSARGQATTSPIPALRLCSINVGLRVFVTSRS